MRVPVVTQVNDSIRYGFAVGKVRVLETRVFGRATYERLLDAASFQEQRRILSDSHYGRYLEGVTTPDGVERALYEALDDFYRFLDEAELPPSVTEFFRIRYDFTNLKGALKAQSLGIPATGLFTDLGTVPVEQLSDSLGNLPDPMGEVAKEVLSGEATDPRTIDGVVDRALYTELGRIARSSGSSFLVGLAKLMADLANAKIVLRGRLAGLAARDIEGLLVDGGSVETARLLELYALPPLDAAAQLAKLPALSGAGISDISDIRRLDVIADNVVVHYLRAARAVPIGPEPVIAYVLAREAEIVALRIVLIGKLSKIDPEVLRQRLRESLVEV